MMQSALTPKKNRIFWWLCCATLVGVLFATLSSRPASAEETVPVLKVELGQQPEKTVLPKGSRGNIFTRVNLTAIGGDVEIKSLTIQRSGGGSDGAFSSVGIEDIGDSGDLNALHQFKVKPLSPLLVPAGETIEIELVGNMKSSLTAYNYEQPTLSLVAIETVAKIEGVLPITGTAHTIVSGLTIGTIKLSQGGLDPRADRDLAVLEKDVILSSIRVAIGKTEDIRLKNLYWIPVGSASDDDIVNPRAVILYKDSVWELPANIYYDDDGTKKYRVHIDETITIQKGDDFEIYLKSDIGQGVNRTIRMNPDKLNGIGALYGYEVRDTTSRASVTFTIVPALFQISGANSFETFNGETRLGEITLEVRGEVARVARIELRTDARNATGIKLWKEGGGLIAGPVAGEGNTVLLTLAKPLELPTGKNKLIVTGHSLTAFRVSALNATGKDSSAPLRITGI